MLQLLLIELALGGPGILVAASVIVMYRRRSRDQPWMPVTERYGAAAEPADGETAQREAAGVPGLSHDIEARDLGAPVDEQRAAAGAVTIGERIASYYAEADRPMAEYLAARGWTGKPGRHGPG
jgi:hypothetical protein